MAVKFDQINFTGADIIKFVGVAGMLTTMYVNLIVKIEQGNARYTLLEYRITALEKKQQSFIGPMDTKRDAKGKDENSKIASYIIVPGKIDFNSITEEHDDRRI